MVFKKVHAPYLLGLVLGLLVSQTPELCSIESVRAARLSSVISKRTRAKQARFKRSQKQTYLTFRGHGPS